MKSITLLLLTLLIASALNAQTLPLSAEDLTVLKPAADGTTAEQAFEQWLTREFVAMTEQRSAAFEKMIKSAAACREWQEKRRRFFLERIGGLPERTPLNPQITGTLKGKGYRVENIVLETRPAFHLTANLYLPDTPPPWPAVLVPCGHSHEGKAAGQYQLICMLLARHGMAAICYDPIGQGERYQMLDTTRERTVFDDACECASSQRAADVHDRAHGDRPQQRAHRRERRAVPHLGRHARRRLPAKPQGHHRSQNWLHRQQWRRHGDRVSHGTG
jgi:hypothetical protein